MESPLSNGPAEALRWQVDGDRLTIDTRVDQDAWMVVAQAALPGWRARADGRPARVAIADGALVAVQVPAGTQTVTLRYLPTSWIAGLVLSVSAWIVSGILLIRASSGLSRQD